MASTETAATTSALILEGHGRLKAGHPREAEQHYRQALALDPGHPKALAFLGRPKRIFACRREAVRARPQARWRNLATMDDEAFCRQVRTDKIDILVDLSGHFEGSRLVAFAAKPAPVISTWLGYPATTGLAAVDWRITDAIVDPPGAEAFHTERLMRLDGGSLCYGPPAAAPEGAPAPVFTKG